MRGIGDCSSVVELFTVVDGEAQRCGCEDKAVLCCFCGRWFVTYRNAKISARQMHF